jgi:hypothetical protein
MILGRHIGARFGAAAIALVIVLSACSSRKATEASEPAPERATVAVPAIAAAPAASPGALPQDVAAFVADRDACDHFRGEEPYDAKRAAFLASALERLCTGSDRKLAALRARYAADARILARLADYEDRIE